MMAAIPIHMRQVEKPAGFGKVRLASAEVPIPGPREILVRNRRSLISRGSEIGGRYRKESAVDPGIVGYSSAGDVVAVGPGVDESWIGKRVGVVAPHAEYILGDLDAFAGRAVSPIPDSVTYEQATFHPLALGGVIWTSISAIQPTDQIAVMGLGLVGNLVLQAAALYSPSLLIGLDAIEARCSLAERVGAHSTINVREMDPVEEVKARTDGQGATLVLECVGGPAGVKSFPQAVKMTRPLGRIHLISLYHEEPLALDSSAIQGRMLIGGYYVDLPSVWREHATEAMNRIADGRIEVDALVSHRFRPEEAQEAFDLLHDRLAEAMGVVFDWDA